MPVMPSRDPLSELPDDSPISPLETITEPVPLSNLCTLPGASGLVPGLAEKLAAHAAALTAYDEARDVAEDYQSDAREARKRRQAVIRANAAAVADGKPRAKVPDAPSEADEAVEMETLVRAATILASRASRAADDANRLAAEHAQAFLDAVAPTIPASIDDALAALDEAERAMNRALGVRNFAVSARAQALAGHRPRKTAVQEIAGAIYANGTAPAERHGDARAVGALSFAQLRDYLGGVREFDLDADPRDHAVAGRHIDAARQA